MNRPADTAAATQTWKDAKGLTLAAEAGDAVADAQPQSAHKDAGFRLLAARSVLDRALPLTRDLPAVSEASPEAAVARLAQSTPRLLQTLALFEKALPDKARKRARKAVRRVNQRVQQANRLDAQRAQLAEYLDGDIAPRHVAGAERLLLRLTQSRQRLQPALAGAAEKAITSKSIDRLVDKLKDEVVEAQVVAIHPRTDMCYQQAWRDLGSAVEDVLAQDPHVVAAEIGEAIVPLQRDLLTLRHLAEAYAMLYAGSLREGLTSLSRLQDAVDAVATADRWVRHTLPGFIDREERRTVEYFGYARGFPRLRSGAKALIDHHQARHAAGQAQLQQQWRDLKDQGFWTALREQWLAPIHR